MNSSYDVFKGGASSIDMGTAERKNNITRVFIADPSIADVGMARDDVVLVTGKKTGITTLYVWTKDGKRYQTSLRVAMDVSKLVDDIHTLFPSEQAVRVRAISDSCALSGLVADSPTIQSIVAVAGQDGCAKVINLMSSSTTAQVMLEVKVVEVQKTLDDKLGSNFSSSAGSMNVAAASFFPATPLTLLGGVGYSRGLTNFTLQGEIDKGRAKILAEPNIVAISGQEASFLAGGKIYIPLQAGFGQTTLQEEDYGVGLTFTPTVLAGGLINLRVSPEVSELAAAATFGSGASLTTMPTITTRKASTTVQIHDGESFAIGGLIQSNIAETLKAYPFLGELPILGPLFRSSDFQNNKTELVFIVTPHLVRVPASPISVPDFKEPSRYEFDVKGNLEGK